MKKSKFMFFGMAVLAVGMIGGTWAAWSARQQAGNEYMIPQYKTSLEEKFTPPDDWQPGITTQKQVWVSNNVKDSNGESKVPAIAMVEISQDWIRNQNIYKKDTDGNDILVAKEGEIPPFTFTDEEGVAHYAAVPNFSKENVCVLSSGKAKTNDLSLGLDYVDTPGEAEGRWLLVDEEPDVRGNYTLYYMGIIQPGEDSPVFLESVTMNPLLEGTLTSKETTYEKLDDGTYRQVTVTNVNSKYGYDGCRYTMDIKATTVQATKDAVDHVFGQGKPNYEVIRHLAENIADDGVYDHYDLNKTLTLVRSGGKNSLAYVPYRTESGKEEGNWFMEFRDMLPGGTYKDKLNVENVTSGISARLYMRILPREQTAIKDELLELIDMTVVYEDAKGNKETVYEGKVTGAKYGDGIDLQRLIPLTYLRPGDKGVIWVEMHVDPTIELDPETGKCIYADELSQIDWEFVVQNSSGGGGGNPGGGGGNPGGGGGNPGGPDETTTIHEGDVPLAGMMIPDEDIPLTALAKTGDNGMTLWYALIAAGSFALFVLLAFFMKREEQTAKKRG